MTDRIINLQRRSRNRSRGLEHVSGPLARFMATVPRPSRATPIERPDAPRDPMDAVIEDWPKWGRPFSARLEEEIVEAFRERTAADEAA